MNETKYKIGDEVTVSRVRGPHKIEAVKEQYYIRDEGWFDACALTPYVRPIKAGDIVRIKHDAGEWKVVAIDDLYAWIKYGNNGGRKTCALNMLVRVSEEAA